tara:strand:- start:593 stop:1015 length:423 start_codon:yes stop_codon:yes gene_type:complete
MSQKLQFKIRLDEDLHEKIKQAAAQSGRSVNAEIVLRLEQSVAASVPADSIISAEQARLLADKAIADGYNLLLRECMNEINESARAGHSQADIIVDSVRWSPRYEAEVVEPVLEQIRSLGYAALLKEHPKKHYRVIHIQF